MKLQNFILWGALLLLTPITFLPRTMLVKGFKRTYCQDVGYDTDTIYRCDKPVPEYCGIDKATGAIQGCVAGDKCPNDGADTNEKLVCSSTKPSCCCGIFYEEGDNVELRQPCNDIVDVNDDSKWKQACSLPELKNLPFCKVNPTSKVWCTRDTAGGGVITEPACKDQEFYCGIDKTSGELKSCVKAKDCPAGAQSSREIVCEPGKPNCCCQMLTTKGKEPVGPNCNNFKEDYSIWKQACGLKELRDLDVCKGDPPKTTTATTTTSTTTTTQEPIVATASSTTVALGVSKALYCTAVNGWLLYYLFFKRWGRG